MAKGAITKYTKGSPKKGTRSSYPAITTEEDKIENATRVNFLTRVGALGLTADKSDPDSLLRCFHTYLQMCQDEGQRVGNMGAYLAMGISRQYVEDIVIGRKRQSDPRYKDLMMYVKAICAAHREQLANDGRVHPAIAIFQQRNFDGMTNEDPKMLVDYDPMGERRSAEEIREKYADLPED